MGKLALQKRRRADGSFGMAKKKDIADSCEVSLLFFAWVLVSVVLSQLHHEEGSATKSRGGSACRLP